ncbi:glycosyltransferase family 2 protein [candidate division KSB1 bacterium]|nr:glycosyltransferase family 2 protein [candidate division KSB1 bacterium]
MKPRILTIISNFNEQREIENCIRNFREHASIESDLLVIDNSSFDKSIELIRAAGVDYVAHPVNTGGSAGVIKTALRYSFMHDYDVYCHLDGDNQHDPAELHRLLQPILDDAADIVIGSRFINKEGFQSFFFRRMGIFTFSGLVSWLAGQKITDLTSGFRAYNRRAIMFFAHQYKHEFEACAQMLLISSFAGLRIQEVPVVMHPRRTGKSEFNLIKMIKFPVYSMISIFGALLQRDRIKELANATQF